jgi:hypothetical protein
VPLYETGSKNSGSIWPKFWREQGGA